MVPAEGIEPPTFGLQNRCSTAELSRRRWKMRGRARHVPELSVRSGVAISDLGGKCQNPRMDRRHENRRPEGRLFRRAWLKLAYWQMCRRPSSPLNQVPGVQTKPLRWA